MLTRAKSHEASKINTSHYFGVNTKIVKIILLKRHIESVTIFERIDKMKLTNLNIRIEDNEKKLEYYEKKINTSNELILERLQEAETEMSNISERYTINDIENSMNDIIDKTV